MRPSAFLYNIVVGILVNLPFSPSHVKEAIFILITSFFSSLHQGVCAAAIGEITAVAVSIELLLLTAVRPSL